MENVHDIYWRLLQSRVSNVAGQLTSVHLAWVRPSESWRPAIDAYCCRDGIILCVDLAGVEKSDIQLMVEPRRVLIRGRRQPPEPDRQPLQVLALEIDRGAFEREVVLPVDVDPERVQAEQRNGMLWVHLPSPGDSDDADIT